MQNIIFQKADKIVMKQILRVTDENDDEIRIDSYLSDYLDISRAQVQKLIKSGNVLINGENKKPSLKVRLNDIIEIEETEEKTQINPQNIPLDIVWEDENMLVVNKPSGMLTHPTQTEQKNTLVNALLYKYGENLSDINGLFRRGIVHRLDRNTSGLLMIAKNNKTHEYLAQQIKDRLITKKYLAIVKGIIHYDEGEIDEPIARNPKNPVKMMISSDGKPSLTLFKVLKRYKDCTYVELDLKTGRTHQIRVHMSYMKTPVLNDTLYGAGNYKVKTQEQVLQSYKLSFTRPFSDDIISLQIEPDEKIKKVLNYLEQQKY